MDKHEFHCDCGAVFHQIGPWALLMLVNAHFELSHQTRGRLEYNEMLELPEYKIVKTEPVVPTGSGVLSYSDRRFLESMKISVDADPRTFQELSARYSPRYNPRP